MVNDMVYNYLVKNYSPKRVRVKRGFKSTYICNGIHYYAASNDDMKNLAINLNKLITIVFNFEMNSHSKTINKFLRIF